MKETLLKILACPNCKCEFDLIIAAEEQGEIKEGKLICKSCSAEYIISNYIPRFVKDDMYVDSFSFEWNLHRATQLDSISRTKESEETFRKKTGFNLKKLTDKLVLDVGCGAGRFMEVVEKCSGEIVGIDLSFSVDAAFKNLGFKENVHIIQADVFDLPFKEEVFDYIYSIGVLHHTPNTEKAFKCLPKFLKNEGEIAIWIYSNEGFFTKILGFILKLALPTSTHPIREWRILDTFDWYSPQYQWKHTYNEVIHWFEEE
jgi:ubiquinone/menaquinone biosynthesis C-methylase UbiE/uncharacterized protein YbaR (Trm112 family)